MSVLVAQAASATPVSQKTLLVYGDSLSAAYGLEIQQGWVSLLQEKLHQTKSGWKVVNLSISGETTAGGLSRLPAALEEHRPELMLLELGANDGLRGTSLKSISGNLEQMIQLAQKKNVEVLLFEMMIPPNYGPAYTRQFTRVFHDLGEQYTVQVVPFFLDGVAGHPELNQPDGIHPTAKAQPKIFDNVWPRIKAALD
ncbi:arylesterase [Endozoicomonas gorgoniicola]|uniref:Arylesterase n=1 Tax=Endozoicomonas gorgoniicola TaxID=1234144 RepID=A0ABT3N1W4_9GAMM|nr:arylesterase [Endozoicomonas gorgoniicola]MCW7555618.1 arylesterase [Endozoicomonas gorgoniicola]